MTTRPLRHLQDLEHALPRLARTVALEGPAGFVARCDALEALEELLVPVAGSPVHPPLDTVPTHADRVLAEAQQLAGRLRAQNARHAGALRADIQAGRCRGDTLWRVLDAHRPAGPRAPEHGWNLAFDALDELVAALLGTDALGAVVPGSINGEEARAPLDPEELGADMVAYQPTPARLVLDLVHALPIVSSDTVVDLGCGLGVVPILVHLLTGARTVGVELQPGLCACAADAARRVGAEAAVCWVCADARDADLTSGTVFYLYTPFRGEVLQRVLQKLADQARRRAVTVCTYGPGLADAVARQLAPVLQVRGDLVGPVAVFRAR